MRTAYAALAIAVMALVCPSASAEDNDDLYSGSPNISMKSGLEAQEVSPGVTVVVPQGAQMSRVNNSLSVLESSEEYAARNFVGVRERLDKIDKNLSELKKEVYFIKKKLFRSAGKSAPAGGR